MSNLSASDEKTKTCRMELHYAGLPSPRTCAICALGPCQHGHMLATASPPPPDPPSPSTMRKADIPAGLFPPVLRKMRDITRWNGSPRVTRDDVAGHSFYVALYARSIAQLVGWRGDMGELLECALLHDVEELFTGDILFHVKRQVVDNNRYEEFAKAALREYLPRFTKKYAGDVTAIVYAADKLDCVFSTTCEVIRGNHHAMMAYGKCLKDAEEAFRFSCARMGINEYQTCAHWRIISVYADEHRVPENYLP